MDPRFKFETRLLAAFVAAVLVVAVLAGVSWNAARDIHQAALQVSHSQGVLDSLARSTADTHLIESSTLRFMIYGGTAQLAERDSAISAREISLRRINELTAGNPRQQERWGRLRKAADERLAISGRAVLLRETEGFEAARAYSASAPVRETRTRLFQVLREMEEEERRLLQEHSAEQTEVREFRSALSAISSLLLAALLAATYVMTRRQLSARARAAAALRESEEGLATTLHSIGDAVLAIDTEGRVTRMNPVAERLTGWLAAEAQGRPVDEVFRIVNEQTRVPAEVPVAKVLATGEIQGLANHTLLIARDGTEWPIADSAAPIRDAAGQVGGVVLVFRDVTAERQAERTILEQNELLEQRVRERAAQLRENEAQLQTVFENLAEGVVVSDLDGRVLQFNRAAIEMFGFASREEYLRRLPEFADTLELSTLDGAILPVDQWPLARVLRDETLRDLEVGTHHVRHGWRKIFSYGGSLVLDADGQPLLALVTIRDITERKRTEAALHREQEFIKALLQNVAMGVVACDAKGTLVLFNQTACEWHGMNALTLPPQEWARHYDLFEADGQTPLPTDSIPLLRAFRGETIRDVGMAIIAKGQAPRFILASGTSFYDADGSALGAVAVMHDITERKQAEQRIQAQLEHLGLLDQITRSTGERLDLKSIFQIVLIRLEDSLPVDFGCVCLHDAVAGTLQVTCVGAKSEALAHELMIDEQATIAIDENGLSRCIQGHLVYEPDVGQVRFPFPARLARGGLSSLVLAPLRSESRVFGVLVVARRTAQAFSSAECEFLRQLSEHVALAAHQAQLYGSLQQAYDDLRQTQAAAMQEERLRALGQMASGIAHDINNALSPVSLYVESMLETEPALSERARGYLETIQRAVEDVAQTVARMREFYRKREQQLELTPVQLNSLVQQVVDLTRARWRDMPQSHGIVIRALTELASDLPEVMGVESEIREALTNLVFNAVDAMPEGGTLTLRTRIADTDPQHPAVAVEVADTGAGMDEDTRRRCLEPFFTTKGERGTGLGLAMVFGMVQRHSAEVEIDSTPGAGTTVRLLFAVPTAVQTETGAPARALQAPSRLRLLLIDDDPMLLKALQDALETDGHVIVTANGGEAGVAAFRASLERGEPFAAVITDLGMPYVDGRRVAAAVKDASPATPVILLTGWGQRLVADNDIPPHVDRVLAKPPRLREVREALAQLCRPQTPEATT